jgi:hypothetical protein
MEGSFSKSGSGKDWVYELQSAIKTLESIVLSDAII